MAKRDVFVNRKMQVAQQAPIIGDTMVEVAANLSRLNHKLYRQGMVYSVKVDMDPTSAQTVDVFALNPTWILKRAWMKAMETYMNANHEEREAARAAGFKAKWEDFRVSHGVNGVGVGYPLLYTELRAPTLLTGGEFDASIVEANGVVQNFTLGSSAANSWNILEQFDLLYRPNESTPTAAIETAIAYGGLTGDEELSDIEYDAMQDHGNLPPYNQSVESSTPWIKVGQLHADSTSTTGQRLSTGYFDAPLGFVILENFTPGTDQNDIIVEVQAGDYKGVNATPIGTAKRTGKLGYKVV